MADVATIFGWSLEAMERMSLAELVAWQARAVARLPAAQGT